MCEHDANFYKGSLSKGEQPIKCYCKLLKNKAIWDMADCPKGKI